MRALGHDPFAVERYERWASVDAAGEQSPVEPYSAHVAAAFEGVEPAEGSRPRPG